MFRKGNISRLCQESFRCYCSRKEVRVRFAPSPTGNLHLGGLRTALYNYLFARSQNGKFILRIEDTDKKRTTPGSIEQIIDDLSWCGILPDEGPTNGGKFGPYLQSQRKNLYKDVAGELIEKGAAYYCFCSEKRLDLLRKDAQKRNLVPKYDNKCRNLSPSEINAKLSSGMEKCIRFKLTKSLPFTDLIFGEVFHEVEEVEGDPVILKKDNWPTYHLANVVDDNIMEITHVIRGVEWLQSTNKHLMIYSALGYSPPQFAHLPLLLNADGSKLSKRQQNLSVESLRKKGIFPKTIINFICHTSSGFSNNIEHKQSYTIEELVKKFDLRAVGTSSNRLPFDRLGEFNRLEILRQLNSPEHLDTLIDEIKELLQNTFTERDQELEIKYDHIKKILLWSGPRISSINDLIKKDLQFLWIKPSLQNLQPLEKNILNELKVELQSQTFNSKKDLNEFLQNFSQIRNMSFKELMSLLRKVISGLEKGPGVPEILMLLGKNVTISRLERAISEDFFRNETVQ